MRRHVYRLLGRLLATVALIGYLTSTGEQSIPDEHAWHGAGTAIVPGTPGTQAGHSESSSLPVLVCHDGHQHTIEPMGIALFTASAKTSSDGAKTLPDQPWSPPPHSFFRPPIV